MAQFLAHLRSAVLAAALAVGAVHAPALAQTPETGILPRQVQGLEVQEHLGGRLPLELEFVDSTGRKVSLGDYFPAASGKLQPGVLPKPAIVMIGYYGCPVVCSLVKDKIVESLDKVDMTAGKDFNFLYFSFEPADTAQVAQGAKEHALRGYARAGGAGVDEGFAFHAGEVEATRQLANAVGFPYRRLENGEYSHPVALFVISPEGIVTRYIYGFSYPPPQVKMALLDATDGKLAKSIGDFFMYYCYMYDANAGQYTVQAMRVMKLGGVVVMISVAFLIGGLRLSEYLKKNRSRRSSVERDAAMHNTSVTGPVA